MPDEAIPCLCDEPKPTDPLLIQLLVSHHKRVNLQESWPFLKQTDQTGMLFHKNLNIREDFRNLVRQVTYFFLYCY